MYFIVEKTLGKLRRLFSRKRCEEKETLKCFEQKIDVIKCVRNITLTEEWKMYQEGLEKDSCEGNSTVWNHIVMVRMRGDLIQCRSCENGSKCIDQKDI